MFAVLHIADFPLHAVLRLEPDTRGKPAALFTGTRKKSLVLATTPAARATGVELGMTAPQAVARCPALIIRAPNATAEAEARAALLAVAFTLSPSIETTLPGTCTIDLRGAAQEKSLPAAHFAVTSLKQLGLPAAAGLARTPLLALYAAHAAKVAAASSRSSHRLEADATSPPQSVLFIAPDSEKSFLALLPLRAAGPSPTLAAILTDWGLRTLGDLTALPRDEIVRRFGAEGLALWQRASGGDTRPLRPVVPPQTFTAAMDLENEIETLEPLLFLLRRFLDRLSLELIASQHVAAEIALTLRLEDATRHGRSFRLPEPTADPEILFRALHTHFESLHTAAAIVAIDLRLTPTRPLVRQQGLFETGLRDPHGFAETLARLVALVGPDRIGTPQLENTHRPDAVQLSAPPAVVPPSVAPPLHAPLGLPLCRFRPPLPARVEFTDGRQSYLWTDLVRGEISFRSARMRGNGDWWQRDRAWSRTEWDIALATGGLYRLLLVGDAYFIEGEYD